MTVETFLANFGHLADAPNGVRKLRELILQLAVQGKLVPQDPKDEPASALVEKSFTKKKTLRGMKQDDGLFVLPDSWLWVKLGDVSVIERGGSPRPIKDFLTDDPEGLNWIKIGDSDIGGKYIASTKEKIRKEGLKKSRMVYPGDFLLTNSMSFGRPYITKIEGCIHDGWLRIHPPEILDKDFLYNLLSSQYVSLFFKGAAAGAVVSNLNTDKVRELPIPIPPLAEQHRIVAKVGQLMALCDELEARQRKQQEGRVRLNNAALDVLLTAGDPADFIAHWQRICANFDLLYDHPDTIAKLRAAILQLAVQGKLVPQDPKDEPAAVLLGRISQTTTQLDKGKRGRRNADIPPVDLALVPYDLPQNWEWARFGHVAIIASNLVQPKSYQDYPHVAPDNIEKGNGKLLPYQSVKEDKVRSSNHLFYAGQILYSKIRPNLSKVTVVNFKGLCSADMYPINALIDTYFLLWYMLSGTFLSMAVKSDTRVAMPKINQEELNKILVPVPPLAEQKRIVAKVDQLMALCDALEANLNQARQQSERLMEASVRQLLVA